MDIALFANPAVLEFPFPVIEFFHVPAFLAGDAAGLAGPPGRLFLVVHLMPHVFDCCSIADVAAWVVLLVFVVKISRAVVVIDAILVVVMVVEWRPEIFFFTLIFLK